MSTPHSKTHFVDLHLLSDFMRATALGVFCAGVLLFDQEIVLGPVIFVREHCLARLVFLLWIGISFGVGTTLAKMF